MEGSAHIPQSVDGLEAFLWEDGGRETRPENWHAPRKGLSFPEPVIPVSRGAWCCNYSGVLCPQIEVDEQKEPMEFLQLFENHITILQVPLAFAAASETLACSENVSALLREQGRTATTVPDSLRVSRAPLLLQIKASADPPSVRGVEARPVSAKQFFSCVLVDSLLCVFLIFNVPSSLVAPFLRGIGVCVIVEASLSISLRGVM